MSEKVRGAVDHAQRLDHTHHAIQRAQLAAQRGQDGERSLSACSNPVLDRAVLTDLGRGWRWESLGSEGKEWEEEERRGGKTTRSWRRRRKKRGEEEEEEEDEEEVVVGVVVEEE